MAWILYGFDPSFVATDSAGNVTASLAMAVHTTYAGSNPFTATKAVNPTTLLPGADTGGVVTSDSLGRLGFFAQDYTGTLYLRQGSNSWAITPTFDTDKPVSADQAAALSKTVVSLGVTNGTDDTAALNAKITALGTFGSGTIRLNGNIKLSSLVTVPAGIGIIGDGANMTSGVFRGSTILCTTSAAGLLYTGSGSLSQGFTVDGNGVATKPMTVGLGAGRTFVDVCVVNSAQDNWSIEMAQNIAFVGCQSQGAARDNLLLDLGCGGLSFVRFESSNPGRYALRVAQTGSSPAVYTDQPQHITFDTCVFEDFNHLSNVRVQFDAGTFIKFNQCVVSMGLTETADSVVHNALGQIEFASCRIFVGTAKGITVSNAGSLVFSGRNNFIGPSGSAALNLSHAVARVYGSVYPQISTGMLLHTAVNNTNVQFVDKSPAPKQIVRDAVGDAALDVLIEGEAGARFRVFANGTIGVGDGTDYSFPVRLTKGAGTVLNLTGGLGISAALTHTGTTAGFYNKTPITQQANTVDPRVALSNLGLIASGASPMPGSTPPQVDVFTSSATWTKPTGAVLVRGFMCAGGTGGASGRRGAAGTVRCGGGAGAGGGVTLFEFDATDLTSTVAVSIGVGGSAGASVTTDDTNGNAGGLGGSSAFGAYAYASVGGASVGGTNALGTGGTPGAGTVFGGTGASASTTGLVGSNAAGVGGPGGGGSGGGISAANVAANGGNGVTSRTVGNATVAGGIVDTTAPAAGTAPTVKGAAGPGAGGGAASITTAAQAGANAVGYGGGGGGGGASLNGNASGAGGTGAPGYLLIITYFS